MGSSSHIKSVILSPRCRALEERAKRLWVVEFNPVEGQSLTSVQTPCGSEAGEQKQECGALPSGCLAARMVLVSELPDPYGLKHLVELCVLVLLILAQFFNLPRAS